MGTPVEETAGRPSVPAGRPLTLFLCGDVMLGRGVDQVLPHRGDPELRESWACDARDYVALARAAHGPVPAPVDFDWSWGDALDVLGEISPAARGGRLGIYGFGGSAHLAAQVALAEDATVHVVTRSEAARRLA